MNDLLVVGRELDRADSPLAKLLASGDLKKIHALFEEWEEKLDELLKGGWGPTRARLVYHQLYVAVWALSYKHPKVRSMFEQCFLRKLPEKMYQEEYVIDRKNPNAVLDEMDVFRSELGLPAIPRGTCFECKGEVRAFLMYRDLCPACQKKFEVQQSFDETTFSYDEDLK